MTFLVSSFARFGLGGTLAATLLVALPALADDSALRKRIESRLEKAGVADYGQVEVDVADGAVVLRGFTTTLDAERRALKAARKEAKAAESRIRVVPAPTADPKIRKAVADAVLAYPYYGVYDSVGVGVEDGVVTLAGSVRQPWRKDDIERRVARVEGAREIRNEIRVQPVSNFDDRLRDQLFRRIYGSAMFERYAGWADPPIRIVVENGNVTLTGVVNSPVERAVLESIARGTLSFRVDNQVQVESEIEKEPKVQATNEG